MFPNEDLQRWAGRVCLSLVAALGMMGYYFGNVRFLPIVAGFAILAGLCYGVQGQSHARRTLAPRALRESGQHSAL